MNDINFSELTVLELRKVAKEMKVPLGAGISKQGIIDKLTAAREAQNAASAQDELPAEAPEAPVQPEKIKEEPKEAAPTQDAAPAQPQFRQAYVAPQRFGNRPAYQAQPYNRPMTSRASSPMEAPLSLIHI